MTNYAFIYHGGKAPSSPEEGAKVMAAWREWMGSIGENLVNGGNPFGESSTVNSDGSVTGGGGANPASGFSIVNAANADEAANYAKGCPILKDSGSVEVCEAMDM